MKHNYVKTNERRPILSATKMYVINSCFWQYKSFVDIRRRFLLGCLQTSCVVVEIDEFAVFPLPYLCKVSEITSALIAFYDNTSFWIPAGTNKDNLE